MTPAENKALRESMGLTLKWLANRWGVTVQSVKRWEGSRTPPPQIAKDMLSLKRKFDEEVNRLVETGTAQVNVPRRDRDCKASEQSAAWARAVAQRAREQTGLRIEFRDNDDKDTSNAAYYNESSIV